MIIGIIGSGLSGLVTASLLKEKGHTVHVFEAGKSWGFSGTSEEFEIDGRKIAVNSPMRSINDGSYPELVKLFRRHDISLTRTPFSYSYALLRQDPYFLYEGSGRPLYSKVTFPSRVKTPLDKLKFIFGAAKLSLNYSWFLFALYVSSALQGLPFKQFDLSRGFLAWSESWAIGRSFIDDMLSPLFGSIMSVDKDSVASVPAYNIVSYLAKTIPGDHYTVTGGVGKATAKLSKNIDHLYFDDPVLSILREKSGLSIRTERRQVEVDAIVFASQAPDARRILEASSSDFSSLVEALRPFEVSQTTVVNHTDTSVLPKKHSDWRDINISFDPDTSKVEASHVIYASEDKRKCLIQTTSPISSIDPSKSLSSYSFRRAIVTPQSARALSLFERSGPCQGWNGIYFTGAWVSRELPLLEGCVTSAQCVAEKIGQI